MNDNNYTNPLPNPQINNPPSDFIHRSRQCGVRQYHQAVEHSPRLGTSFLLILPLATPPAHLTHGAGRQPANQTTAVACGLRS